MKYFDRSRRLLFGAFALSVLAHLLAAFGWGWERPPPTASAGRPLQVVVAAPSPPPVAAAKPPAIAAASAVRPKAPPRIVAASPPAPAAVAVPAVRAEPAPAIAPEASTPVLPVASPEASAKPAAAAVAAISSAAGGAVADADGLRQYRIELAVAARSYRLYPSVARARGWQGVAEVGVNVSPGLSVPQLRLVRSSGHAVLDEQALRMLARAAEGTPLPESLRGRSFSFAMPIRFSLEE